jgi:hypothetical protein
LWDDQTKQTEDDDRKAERQGSHAVDHKTRRSSF